MPPSPRPKKRVGRAIFLILVLFFGGLAALWQAAPHYVPVEASKAFLVAKKAEWSEKFWAMMPGKDARKDEANGQKAAEVAAAREAAAREAERPVLVQKVALAPAKAPRILVGTLRARIEGDQGFRIGGKIARREVQLGDRVKAGSVLASLDETDLNLQRESALAELAAARSVEKQAEIERDRISALRKQGWSTDQALDRQKSVMDEAIGRRSRAERQVELATNAQSYSQLVAENDGIVIAVFAEAGQVVAAGQAIVRIARDGDREAQVAIPEQDLDEARSDRAEVALWSEPGKLYSAKLRELSPNADPATRTFQARFLVEDLAPDAPLGMTVTLRLSDTSRERVARVPISAIFNQGAGTEVFVLAGDGQTLEKRPVTVIGYDSHEALVSAGLSEADQVVTLGIHKLRDGQRVRTVSNARLG